MEKHTRKYIAAFDLGTGGLKASLFDTTGILTTSVFRGYPTEYISNVMHEQRPNDWWEAFCTASSELLSKVDCTQIACICISGHSLVTIPYNHRKEMLIQSVPIWSDTRADKEAEEYFDGIDYDKWYLETGNGDAPGGYPIFKLMWLKNNRRDIWEETEFVLGSKDYINYMLTGEISTDYSYASGSGYFNLLNRSFSKELYEISKLEKQLIPDPEESCKIIGKVHHWASELTGFAEGTPVAAGGVDNALMALGTLGCGDGRAYMSLGSCAWISLISQEPILDAESRPFIFAFTEKDYYVSGVSIFAGGSAHRWVADNLFPDVSGDSRFDVLNSMAEESVPGSNGLFFNPTLSGASPQEPGSGLKGCFYGLTMSSTRNDIIRSVMEGIAFSLKVNCYDVIKNRLNSADGLLVTGGGTKSDFWMQMFADIFNIEIRKDVYGQEATSKGAACVGAKAVGLIDDYSDWNGKSLCRSYFPDRSKVEFYKEKAFRYKTMISTLAKL